MYKPDLNEHIKRIGYITKYVVNESPKYNAIMDGHSYDSIPEGWDMKEAEGLAPVPTDQTDTAPSTPSPAVSQPQSTPITPDPAAVPQNTASATTPPESSVAPSNLGGQTNQNSTAPDPVVANIAQTKDELQKKVLEYQLDAMRNMNSKIQELEQMVNGLNSQLSEFSSEVEKVREPSDVEKFDERKLDSHPYYYNLNDLWNNNTFQARMDTLNSKGIVKTKDGYQADFDQLPKLSQYEVRDSFDAV